MQQWLIDKELDEFQASFMQHGITGKMLALMNDAMLGEMQIKAGIPRTRIMAEVEELQQRTGGPTSGSSSIPALSTTHSRPSSIQGCINHPVAVVRSTARHTPAVPARRRRVVRCV